MTSHRVDDTGSDPVGCEAQVARDWLTLMTSNIYRMGKNDQGDQPTPWVIRRATTMGGRSFKQPLRLVTADEYQTLLLRAKEAFDKRFNANDNPKERIKAFKCWNIIKEDSIGKVYMATHKYHSEELTLKLRIKQEIMREGITARIINEKKLTWAMRNRFITPLLYAFQDSTNIYMVTERAMYGDLSKLSERLDEPQLKMIVAQIVLAFEYIHECRVIHRNLRDTSILVYEDYYVKLGSFGLAKKLEVGRDATSSIVGWIPFHSPQHQRRQDYGRDFDFWNLGSLIFMLYYGTCPHFDPTWDVQTRSQHVIESEPEFPENTDRAQPINQLISALLEKEPQNRLGTTENGIAGVKAHRWFTDINFIDVFNKRPKLTLPIKKMTSAQYGGLGWSMTLAVGDPMTEGFGDFADF